MLGPCIVREMLSHINSDPLQERIFSVSVAVAGVLAPSLRRCSWYGGRRLAAVMKPPTCSCVAMARHVSHASSPFSLPLACSCNTRRSQSRSARGYPRRSSRLLWYTHQRPTGTTRRDGTTHRGRGTMAKRIGFGDYQYEAVEHWPKVELRGAVADVCVDARGRVYAGVRNPREDGAVSNILGGAGIEIWKRDGTKVGSWGEKGEAPGQFVAGSVHGA